MTKNEFDRKSYVQTTDETFSIRQAIELSKVTRKTFDKWIKKYEIVTHRQMNGQLLIDKQSLEQVLDKIKLLKGVG